MQGISFRSAIFGPRTSEKQPLRSVPYEEIPYTPEQGIF